MPRKKKFPMRTCINLFDSMPTRKKLMLIDAYHSCEVDKEEGVVMSREVDSMGLSKRGRYLIQLDNRSD